MTETWVGVVWSASEAQVQVLLFRHVCRHHLFWTCFLQLVIQMQPNEYMATLTLHMGMNFLISYVALAFWRCHRSDIPLPSACEGVMALSSVGHRPQGRAEIPQVHPLRSPSRKASMLSFSLFARESKYTPAHPKLIMKTHVVLDALPLLVAPMRYLRSLNVPNITVNYGYSTGAPEKQLLFSVKLGTSGC